MFQRSESLWPRNTTRVQLHTPRAQARSAHMPEPLRGFHTKSTHSGYLVSQIRLFSGICWLWGALSTLASFLWKGTVFVNGCLPPNLHQQGWRHKPYLITLRQNKSSIFIRSTRQCDVEDARLQFHWRRAFLKIKEMLIFEGKLEVRHLADQACLGCMTFINSDQNICNQHVPNKVIFSDP